MDLQRLKSAYRYNPETGEFKRMDGWDGRPRLDKSKPRKNAYVMLMVDGERIYAHRAAWWIHYGELPPEGAVIDHKNDLKWDNRIENLRLSTRQGNVARGRSAGALAAKDYGYPFGRYLLDS